MLRALSALVATAVLCILVPDASNALTAQHPRAPQSDPIQVTSPQHRLHCVVGDRFTYRLHIGNLAGTSTERLIAHLNVASLTSDVYVDPEDWSSSRSIVLGPLMPHSRTSVSWSVQAVSAGSFVVYAVVLPAGPPGRGGPLVVSPATHVTVVARHTLSAAGSLPVAIAVPVVLAVLLVLIRVRLRRAARTAPARAPASVT
jgi:hypothetical protein